MSSNDVFRTADERTGLSRRRFVAATALAAAGAALPTAAQSPVQSPKPGAAGPTLVYVGSYSSPQGPEGSRGHGRGIYLFVMDQASGSLSLREVFANDDNPAWLALNPARTRLYSANETPTYKGANSGSVSAYSIERGTGRLKLINTVGSQGAGPAHLSVHPAGKHVFAANYGGGTVAVLPLGERGELREASFVSHGTGRIGPARATSAPPGSFAISGHEAPHMHMIQSDPTGRFILATDLGRDRIFVWKFDAENGRLLENDPPFVSLPPGDGPRHFAFHPNGRWFYCLQEEGSTVAFFTYDAGAPAQRVGGRLALKQTLSSLPKGFAGTNFTSEIVVTSDGRFVYAANRLRDTISWFSISDSGELTFRNECCTRGDYPRSFNIDPSGSFLYSCNQRSDAIAVFRRDKGTGELTFTGQYVPVGTPAIIVFLT